MTTPEEAGRPETPGSPEAPQSTAPGKSARVARRTLVGAGLTLALAVLLWFAERSVDGSFVLVAGTLLSVLAVIELSRMGALREHRLAGLLLPAVAALYLFNRVLTAGRAAPTFALPELAASLALCLLLTTAAFVERSFTLWKSVRVTWALLALGAGLLFLVDVDFGDVEIGWGPAAALLLGWAVCLAFAVSLVRRTRAEPQGAGGAEVAEGPPAGLGRASWCALWVVFPLPALVHVWWDYGVRGLVALLVLAKLGDIAGYYVGNAIGKRHPFPRLSPGKTVAGCVASLVAGTLAGGLCVTADLLPAFPFGFTGGLVAGAAINLAAQAGDLLESAVKRRAGVKDSGTWFGPSGGVLDLVDSLLLSVPVALAGWPLIFA